MSTESNCLITGDGKTIDATQVPIWGRDIPVIDIEKISIEDLTKAVLDAGANTAGGCSPTSK